MVQQTRQFWGGSLPYRGLVVQEKVIGDALDSPGGNNLDGCLGLNTGILGGSQGNGYRSLFFRGY